MLLWEEENVFCKGPFSIAFTIKFPSCTKEICSAGTVDKNLMSIILYCHENIALSKSKSKTCPCASHEEVWGTGGYTALILNLCNRDLSASRSDRLTQ